jgi:uncharacterized iron-regulated protein
MTAHELILKMVQDYTEVLWDKYTDIRVISTALDKFIDAIGANR